MRIVTIPLIALGLAAAACPAPGPTPQGACAPRRLSPLVTGDGAIASIEASSTVPGDLRASDELHLRIRFAGADVPPHLVFIDSDGDRNSGMWTLQSSVSASAWNLLVDEGGVLYRHSGAPTEWRWDRLGDLGTDRSIAGNSVELCLPVNRLGSPEQVRVSVLVGESWLPGAFLPGAPYPEPDLPQPPPVPATPGSLAIHYGARPWLVRDCADPSCAARLYAGFDHVVLGAGLEEPSHPGHDGTRRLVTELRRMSPTTELWGYVSLVGGTKGADGRRATVYDAADIVRLARAWGDLGATGVFLDEADLCRPEWGQSCPSGPDGEPVEVTLSHQHAAIDGIHDLGLPVFANAYAPFDVLGPASRLGGSAGGRPADVYLLENPTVVEGAERTGTDAQVSRVRFELARRARRLRGVRIAAVDTGAGTVSDSDALAAAAYDRASAEGVDVWGFTNGSYSAAPEAAGNLPFSRPTPTPARGR